MTQSTDKPAPYGRYMLYLFWLSCLGLLSYGFSQYEAQQHNPNQNLTSTQIDKHTVEVKLRRNKQGHYLSSGTINGYAVVFFLDTGATDVSIPAPLARQLGLKRGLAHTSKTANGSIKVFSTRLDQLSIGDIVLENVRASINPHMQGEEILLGMSVLKHLEFSQQGKTLTLRQKPN